MKNLILKYKNKKTEIKERLKTFKELRNGKNKDVFQELCFCILTPQSKAVYCDEAIKRLKKSNSLFKGSERNIKAKLKGLVRFHNKKAAYLVAARNTFTKKRKIDLKKRLGLTDAFTTRQWLVKNVKGLGYKEASHFLRNIGLGKDIAILDVHILRNLKKLGIIDKIPPTITKKNYISIENKMREFSKRVDIPLEELDLLFWSNQTGFIFK